MTVGHPPPPHPPHPRPHCHTGLPCLPPLNLWTTVRTCTAHEHCQPSTAPPGRCAAPGPVSCSLTHSPVTRLAGGAGPRRQRRSCGAVPHENPVREVRGGEEVVPVRGCGLQGQAAMCGRQAQHGEPVQVHGEAEDVRVGALGGLPVAAEDGGRRPEEQLRVRVRRRQPGCESLGRDNATDGDGAEARWERGDLRPNALQGAGVSQEQRVGALRDQVRDPREVFRGHGKKANPGVRVRAARCELPRARLHCAHRSLTATSATLQAPGS